MDFWSSREFIRCLIESAAQTKWQTPKTKQITTNWWLNLWKIAFPTVAVGGVWFSTINYYFFFAQRRNETNGRTNEKKRKQSIIIIVKRRWIFSVSWMRMFGKAKFIFTSPLTNRSKKNENENVTLSVVSHFH